MNGPGTACDWDFWVNSPSLCENTDWLNSIASSGTDIKCDDSATSTFAVLTGDKYVKVHRNSGDGTGSVNVKLVECIANNAVDAACPSAKPYCSSNTCVQCLSNDRADGRSSQCYDAANNVYRTCDLFAKQCG